MRTANLILAAMLIVGLAGCSNGVKTPDLGQVSGTVTLNGKPLDGATVEFIPDAGRPSIGMTDAQGKYKLLFRADQPGAVIGTHSVRITSRRDSSGGEGSTPLVKARSETVPQKYNDATTLKVDVKAGSNTHDFPLEGTRSGKASSGA